MRLQKIKATANTVTFKLILAIYLILVPIIVLLITINNQTRATLLAQVESTHQSMLQSYMQRIDSSLQGNSAYVVELAHYSTVTKQAVYQPDEATAAYAMVAVSRSLQDRASSSDLVDGFFALLHSGGDATFMLSTSSTADGADRARVREYIEQNRPVWGGYEVAWETCTLEGNSYLLLVATNGDEICTGMYINLTRLVQRLPDTTDRLQTIPAGELESLAATLPAGHRLLEESSGTAPLQLGYLLDEAEILGTLPFLQRYTPLVTLSLLLLIPVMFLLVRRIVAKPLQTLTASMRRVQGGDLEHRLEPGKKASGEIQILVDTFNGMLEHIQHLKISVYENQLTAQKAQLRNLQLQIRPHFLINSLNMVYNEMESGNSGLAKQLILHTVDYFRYMVRIDDELVPLTAELNHVRAYLEIQSIRYPGMLAYDTRVDSFVEDVLVPPLSVQTFVENSIKYAIQENTPLRLHIEVESFEEDFEPYARITIRDNGGGFSDSVLQKLQTGAPIVDENGGHIGIRNVVRRAELIFGDKASCVFFNRQGAVARLTLPATFR